MLDNVLTRKMVVLRPSMRLVVPEPPPIYNNLFVTTSSFFLHVYVGVQYVKNDVPIVRSLHFVFSKPYIN